MEHGYGLFFCFMVLKNVVKISLFSILAIDHFKFSTSLKHTDFVYLTD